MPDLKKQVVTTVAWQFLENSLRSFQNKLLLSRDSQKQGLVYFWSTVFHLRSHYNSINKSKVKAKPKTVIIVLHAEGLVHLYLDL